MRWFSAWVTLVIGTGMAMAVETELTMRERAGRNRVNEPVRIGVPLPKGAAKDIEKFTLLDGDGQPIPCQFTPVCRWLGDESVKWVHLDFVTDCDSGATRTFTLSTDGGKNSPPKDPLVVEEVNNTVTVKTAGMTVRIRGAKFNFLDRVTVDGKDLVAGGEAGIALVTDAGTFTPVNDADGTVTVESKGPIRALVRCEGALRNAAGEKAFDYVVRFGFHAGLRRVEAQVTYINRIGTKPADRQEMQDLAIYVPTTAPADAVATVGTAKGHASATPGAGSALSIFQTTSDRYTVFTGADSSKGQLNRWAGKFLERGPGKQTKPLTTGWGGYTWKDGGIAAGWRWFWQSHPSIIELRGGGLMRLGLFPREGHKTLPVYMGQARTHDVTLVFGSGGVAQAPSPVAEFPAGGDRATFSANRLNAIYAGVQRPLRAFPSATYLCRDSAAFGLLGESDPKLYGGLWDRIDSYDRVLRDTLTNHMERVDGALYRNRRRGGEVTEHTKGFWIDGYGYRPWGDVILWMYMNEEYPWTNSWSGNYYDFSFACLLQWMRTGDTDYLDQVEPATIHEADVFTVNYHPRSSLIGACRYCPPRNHIGVDAGPPRPYVSLEFNHHKAQSTFACWYLFGNERMRDVAMLKLNNAYANHAADNGWKQIRGPGAQLATLAMGYEMTRDEKYLDRMKGMRDRAHRRLTNSGAKAFGHSRGQFMYGIGIEGLIYLHRITGDEKTFEVIKGLTDWLIEGKYVPGRTTTNIAFGLAYCYHITGDTKYRDLAARTLGYQHAKTRGEMKSFGQSYRASGRAFYYIQAKPEKPKE